jgi:hypothetical protein
MLHKARPHRCEALVSDIACIRNFNHVTPIAYLIDYFETKINIEHYLGLFQDFESALGRKTIPIIGST